MRERERGSVKWNSFSDVCSKTDERDGEERERRGEEERKRERVREICMSYCAGVQGKRFAECSRCVESSQRAFDTHILATIQRHALLLHVYRRWTAVPGQGQRSDL